MQLSPRSMLFVSGERVERFAKAFASRADLVCIDLEDAVAPAAKAMARSQVLAWLAARPADAPGPRRALRLNGLRTHDGLRDILALADAGLTLDALLLPKTESAADLHTLQALLGPAAPPLVALLETPQGIEAAAEIARAPVAALMLGGADLSAELGAAFDAEGLRHARGRLVNAARAAARQAWDVPHVGLDDPEALAADTRHALALGFDCKTAIHPQQIATIHAAFRPTPAELAWAEALLAALPEPVCLRPDAVQVGAFLFQGRMVDAPLLRKAQRIAQRARLPD